MTASARREAFAPAAVSASGPFDNHPDAFLADELGDVRVEIADLKEREAGLKAEVLARGLDQIEGERFNLLKVEAARWSLDTAKVKAEMGEDWYVAHSRVTPTVSLRVTPLKHRRARLAPVAVVAEEGGAS